MAGAELGHQQRIGGQRKEAGSRGDAIALNDDGAIVQGAAGMKDGAEQVARDDGVEIDAAFDEGAESDLAFDYDEGADAGLGEASDGEHDFLAELAAFELADAEEWAAAETGKGAAEFGLEHHDERDGRVGRERGEDGMEELEVRPDRNAIDRGEDAKAEQDVNGAAAANDHQGLIDEDSDDDDVDGGGDAEVGEISERGREETPHASMQLL